MDAETTQMSENGRVVIPVSIRRAAGIQPNEVLTVRVDNEGIHLQTRRQAIRKAQAVVAAVTKGRKGLVKEFLRERRKEAASE